jgi:hypothetical protein
MPVRSFRSELGDNRRHARAQVTPAAIAWTGELSPAGAVDPTGFSTVHHLARFFAGQLGVRNTLKVRPKIKKPDRMARLCVVDVMGSSFGQGPALL